MVKAVFSRFASNQGHSFFFR